MLTTGKNGTRVVSALHARANFGKLLRRVEDERRSLLIGKAGHSQSGAPPHPGLCAGGRPPAGVAAGVRGRVRLAAPEPEVLRIIGEESKRKGTDGLTSREIDQIVKTTRAQKDRKSTRL